MQVYARYPSRENMAISVVHPVQSEIFRKYRISKFCRRNSLGINKYIPESARYTYHSRQGVLQMSKVVYAEMDVRPWSM